MSEPIGLWAHNVTYNFKAAAWFEVLPSPSPSNTVVSAIFSAFLMAQSSHLLNAFRLVFFPHLSLN